MKCPGCGYKRKPEDDYPNWQCPSCRNAYNKHPDYIGNNYFSIQLSYEKVPEDKEVKPEILYLYLNKGILEGAVLDNTGLVERIVFSDVDLEKAYPDIINRLNTPQSTLTDEQEAVIFSATARKKKLQQDKIEEETELEKTRYKQFFLIGILIVFIILIFNHFFSNDTENKISKSQVESSTPTAFQTTGINKSNMSNDSLLNANGINLEFIASNLDSADALAKQCNASCQSTNISEDSCEKAKEILKVISLQINKYKEFMQGHSIDGLSIKSKQLIEKINQNLWNLPNKIESAQRLCGNKNVNYTSNKSNSTNPTSSQKTKLVLSNFGIDIRKIQSDMSVCLRFIEKCADYCVKYGRKDVNCTAYNEFFSTFSSDLKQSTSVVNSNGGLQAFSTEDEEIILQINKDINSLNVYIDLIQKNCEK